MTIYAAIDLSVGDQVTIEFTPPYAQEALMVRCFVRNRCCYTYGLEFITENDLDYERVGWLASHLARHNTALLAGESEAVR